MSVIYETNGAVCTVTIDRPEARNAVDGPTAAALADAFRRFDADDALAVAVLTGSGGNFCAGADLKAVASGGNANQIDTDMRVDGPMGPSRMQLSKPVIAAVSGYAVAGGLELALWCDLRVAGETAVFGVFCRRFGVPLIDGGTQRLPRLIGMSRAMDMILTGRAVTAREAETMGLANRVVSDHEVLTRAQALAEELATLPQGCMRSDREAALRGQGLDFDAAMALEMQLGMQVIESGETVEGAGRFARGQGRHGNPGSAREL